MSSDESSGPWIREKSEKEKLKEEIRGELIAETKRKKRKKIFACCLLELAAIIFIFGGATIAIAKTGVVTIPLFSKIFYQPPTPQRIVTVTPEETNTFEKEITGKFEQQVKSQIKPGVTGQKIEVNFELTEKDLTAFLKSAELSSGSPLRNVQASVTPEAIEIFGQLEELNRTFLTVALKPEVSENNLKIKITKIRLGTLSLPAVLGNFLVEKFLDNQIKSAEDALAKIGKLENIILSDGKVTIRGIVDVLVFDKEF